MSFVRTVLGDIPAGELGACDAHGHVIIERGHVTRENPEFALDSVERAAAELREVRAAGGGAIVDTMPCGEGRNPAKLAEASRQSGVHIVMPTGLHLEKYYPPGHWSETIDVEALAALFIGEIERGADGGPHRAGVIKVAGGRDRLSDAQRRNFAAAAAASAATGCPIITHTEAGTAGHEQIDLLERGGADLRLVVLSHVDRLADAGYHRELLARGVRLEYDSAFRWPAQGPNHTLDLLAELLPAFPSQVMVGMDAARQRYWHVYGGRPGLAWLFSDLPGLLAERGIGDDLQRRLFVDNPAETFSFFVPGQTVPGQDDPAI